MSCWLQFHPVAGRRAGALTPRSAACARKAADHDVDVRPARPAAGGFHGNLFHAHGSRHLDRGSREVDNGHFLNYEYVFGATAAAALYRRDMIADMSEDGAFFDPDFFVYREDADVAWRAQLLGWRCLYTPHARGYHVRNVLPGKRRALPPEINMALGERTAS